MSVASDADLLRKGAMAPEDVVSPLIRPVRTARDVALCSAAGLAGFGAAPLLERPGLAWPALAAGAGGAVLAARRGRRLQERAVVATGIIAGLSPLIGVRQIRSDTVMLRRWTWGRQSVPARITVRYYPGIDAGAVWRGEVLRVVAGKTGHRYVTVKDKPRRRLMVLGLDRSPAAVEAMSPARRRLDRAVTELMGATAKTRDVAIGGDGQVVAFTVVHQAGAKLAAGGYRARVEKVLGTMLPGRWRARWDLEGDTVRFEVRPTLPTQRWVPVTAEVDAAALRANYRSVRVPYAVDEDGNEIAWRPAVVPHFLLTGQTGAGKTSTARSLICGLTRNGWPVWIADVKRIEFRDFRRWPNVQVVASTIPQIVAMIHQATTLMRHRYELVETGRAVVADFEPLFVVIDEYTEFVNVLRSWYASIKLRGEPATPVTLDELASILRLGRSARVHLLETAQRPDITLFGSGEMRDNLGQRASLGRLSPNGAQMMWENAGIGVAIPRGLVGRATTTNDDGVPVEAQTYRFPEFDAVDGSDEAALLAALHPTTSIHERLLILAPQPADDEHRLTWSDYAEAPWVRAADRPDLDPVTRGVQDKIDGTSAGSALAVLGVTAAAADSRIGAGAGTATPATSVDVRTEPGDHTDEAAQDVDATPEDGYASATTSYPARLVPGDLICLDDEEASWVVVDEAPEPDPTAPGQLIISWRSDRDDAGAGVISWGEDEPITVRLPAGEEA